MPLREDILAPIPGDNPSGIDLRYDNVLLIYDQIKEARRLDDDLPQGDWQIPRKMAEFPLVVQLAQDAIATVSKDLQVAAWLTEALLQTEGFSGLREGLELCLGLMTDFWDTLYPRIEDGDRELRATPLYWIAFRLDSQVYSVPITAAGYSWNDWAQMLTAGIAGEGITREALENSASVTPSSFYVQAGGDVDGCIEALADLDKFCLERFEDDAPSFGRLNRALADLQLTIQELLQRNRELASAQVDEQEMEQWAADSGSPDAVEHIVEYAAEFPSAQLEILDLHREKLDLEVEKLTAENDFSSALELLQKALSIDPAPSRIERLREILQESQREQAQGSITRLIQRLSQAAREAPQNPSPAPQPPIPANPGPGEFTRIFSAPSAPAFPPPPPRLPAAGHAPPPSLGATGSFTQFFKAPTSPATPPSAGTTTVSVFYATDRLQLPSLTGKIQFGKQRSLLGSLHYGRCEVSIPKTHKMGKLETPSILRLEFRPDPAKHIVLSGTFRVEEQEFFKQVQASVARSAAKDAFVFVHGYNVSFENAARRTGQMAYDLNFVGAPIFYSWPSNGKTADYPKDETNITWSTPHLQRFLTLLAQNTSAKRIYVIAHSMGNRAVCDALKLLSYDPACQLKLTHLVLAAPDIDADTFRELAAMLQKLSARITLYESSKDLALLASKKIHGNPRAGEPLLILPGLDTIDASAIDTDFLGHSYFSDTWPLLSDIHSILFEDQPPERRFGLAALEDAAGKYYAFRA